MSTFFNLKLKKEAEIMLERLEILDDKGLDSYKIVEVMIGRLESQVKYSFHRKGITLPLASSELRCEIRIVKCREKSRLKLCLLTEGKLLFETGVGLPITNIRAEKK